MEARKIVIVSTKNQKKSVIMSEATTLAELKSDLRKNGIDYDGMTFYEGTSKTELKTDESVLPHDVPYKGTTTNELVFMLTNTNKKIRSGAMSRKEVYNKIAELKLQDECKRKFGRNFTQCTTADLISLVEKAGKKKPTIPSTPKAEAKKPIPVKEEKKDSNVETTTEFEDKQARLAIARLVEILYDSDTIDDSEREEVLNTLGGKIEAASSAKKEETSLESPYSDSVIDSMFNFVK